VTHYGLGTAPGQCPPNLVGPQGDNITQSINECNNSFPPDTYCGFDLNFGNTSGTMKFLIPGDTYEVQVETCLAVFGQVYAGSNTVTVTAT
jgi:hypothetical protein